MCRVIPESALEGCGCSALRLPAVQLRWSTASPSALADASGAGEDVQARVPGIPVALSRVGVTGVEKVVRIRDELFFARFDCFVDLSRNQKGAHMSRFDEVVNEAIGEVVLSESPFRAETLAQHIAELGKGARGGVVPRESPFRAETPPQPTAGLGRARQGAERAEVTIAARYP